MPALFALGQHEALQAISRGCCPARNCLLSRRQLHCCCLQSVGPFYTGLWRWPCGTTHGSASTKGRRKCGTVQVCSPLVRCEHIVEAGRRASPPVVVWRGEQPLPTSEQGIRVLGTPFGHSDHVTAELRSTNEEHSTLLSRILAVRDLQCAWLLLLFCVAVQGELVVADSPSVAVRIVCDSARFLGVELPPSVVGYPRHTREDVGQSRAVS